GIGISSKEKLNLFKKFSRGKGMSKIYTEGTGLGLYLASKLIQAHKGRIWVESEGKGKGSKFCFELPVE
ncbi:sensor histidine kinase, partial [Patescibacteria group bacterium]|nr:sensor histidine kinase [Patescibacteria group bacterium]